MIRLLRLGRPRALAHFLMEAGLVFLALYALALITLATNPTLDGSRIDQQVLATGFGFLAAVSIVRGRAITTDGGRRREIVLYTALSIALGMAAFGATWWSTRPKASFLSFLVLEAAVVVPAVLAGWRWLSDRLEMFGGRRERVLIVGSGETARRVCRWILPDHADAYKIEGFASEHPDQVGQMIASGTRAVSDLSSLDQYCETVDRVIVALDEKRGKLPLEALMKVRLSGVEVEDATSFLERTSGKIAVETLLPSWLIFSDGFRVSPVRRVLKRTMDILHAVPMLVVAAPVMAIVAIAIKLDSRGRVFFIQDRVGLNGKEFRLYKFRSMVENAESESGPAWATQNDPRVTRVGRFMRKCRIDEIPQLINVLKGEMSLVGPRPERRHFVDQLNKQLSFYDLRHTVRPGVTGWAQVEYHYGSTVEENREKLKYDLYYVKNNDVLMDLLIVLKTVKVVLMGHGAR